MIYRLQTGGVKARLRTHNLGHVQNDKLDTLQSSVWSVHLLAKEITCAQM